METINERLFRALLDINRVLRKDGMGPGHPGEGPCRHGDGEGCGCGHHGEEDGEGCGCGHHGEEGGEGCGCRGKGPDGREAGYGPAFAGMDMHGYGRHGMNPHMGHGPAIGPEGPHHRPPLARERILEVISDHQEGIHQKEIAASMGVNASSMSEFIDHLEADGYIARSADPADKRATLITLTPKGQARAYEMEDEREAHFAGMFGNLRDEEKEQLIALIGKLTGRED